MSTLTTPPIPRPRNQPSRRAGRATVALATMQWSGCGPYSRCAAQVARVRRLPLLPAFARRAARLDTCHARSDDDRVVLCQIVLFPPIIVCGYMKARRTLCGFGLGMIAAAALHAFQRPFREYPWHRIQQFPKPPDYREKTEWAPRLIRGLPRLPRRDSAFAAVGTGAKTVRCGRRIIRAPTVTSQKPCT